MDYQKLESKILEASINFAELHNVEFNEIHQSMMLNAMREVNFQLNKEKLNLNENEIATIHDIVLGLSGTKPTNDVIFNIVLNLPENLHADGLRWGFDDSVVRDNIYSHLEKEYKKN